MQGEVSNSPPTPRSHRAAVFFVWAVWVFMVAVNLWAVYRYCPVTIPVSDERQELGGGANFTWTWLWELHAEHRIPLAKLIWLGTLRLSDYDFRIGNLLEVAAVAGVAAALMLAVRRVRGETRWTDAFFPLALLNFGQTYAVFLWWWQVNHTLPPLIACVLLLYLVKPLPQPRDLILAASLLVLLSLSGPGGLPYVPLLAVWLIWQCVLGLRRTSAASTWPYTLGLVLPLAAIALVALYFVKFDETMAGKPSPELYGDGIKSSLATTVKLLSVSLGPSTVSNWKIWGLLVALAWLVGFALAAITFLVNAGERNRAAGLLLFLVGNGTLLLVLGWARANYGDHNTFEGHYLLKGVPALCCIYFICELYAGRRTSGECQAFVFALVLVPGLFLIANRDTYVDAAERRRLNAETMAQDIENGRSPYWLYQQYKEFQGADGVDPASVVSEYQHLRHLGLRSFRNLVREKEVLFYAEPIRRTELTSDGTVWEATGGDPFLVYDLSTPRFVNAILVKITYLGRDEPSTEFQLYWRDDEQEFAESRSFATRVEVDGANKTIAIPVNAEIQAFRIDPLTRPGRFKLSEIYLVIPE